MRKTLIFALAVLLAGLRAAELLFFDGAPPNTILELAFSGYILMLSISPEGFIAHRALVWHLSALTAVAGGCSGFALLRGNRDVSALQLTTFSSYALLFLVAGTTPCGPGLHYAPQDIYSAASGDADEHSENVAGIEGTHFICSVACRCHGLSLYRRIAAANAFLLLLHQDHHRWLPKLHTQPRNRRLSDPRSQHACDGTLQRTAQAQAASLFCSEIMDTARNAPHIATHPT